MKSVGHWYIRRERRGLVYLVIDNRHAVEKLKQMEQQKCQVDEKLIENEWPPAFADIFPLSTTTRKRGQSPERKFVVGFRSPVPRSDDDFRRSQEPDEVDFLLANASTIPRDRDLVHSPSQESRNPLDSITGSDVESIGRSTSSQSARMERTRARRTNEQSTSRLILDIIPHEIADEALKSAQNMSRSTMLEAKAEETIDLLMRHWTYVDPEYFSEDERSSVSPSEHSIPLVRNRNLRHSHERGSPSSAKNCSRPLEGSRRQKSDKWGNAGPAKGLNDSQSMSLEEHLDTSSSSPLGQNMKSRESPNQLSPNIPNVRDGREVKARIISHKVSDQTIQTPKEPSTPAPPYPSSQSGQCPTCSAANSRESKACADQSPCQPTGAPFADVDSGLGTGSSLDSAIKLFENRFLDMIRQKSSLNATPDAQSHLATEQQENLQPSVAIEQEAEPVILKDSLGRKFLFPIQKCKSWQVSSPKVEQCWCKTDMMPDLQSMENLIKRSFSHVESMNSKIFRGSYDVLSPTGEIILPEIWDSVIKPGWVVELRFWDSSIPEETGQKEPEIGVDETAPAVQSNTAASRQSLVALSSDAQSATAKRRASLRSWLGGRKSIHSVAL